MNDREQKFPMQYRLATEHSPLANNMTKREAFAMAAMQGLAMRVTSLFDHEVAADAVRLADATLRALKETP